MRVASYSEVLSSFEMTLNTLFLCCMDVPDSSLFPYVIIYYTHGYSHVNVKRLFFLNLLIGCWLFLKIPASLTIIFSIFAVK